MVIYGVWAHCFGCGKRVRSEEVGVSTPASGSPETERYREDLDQALEHIRRLPHVQYRGLSLPGDASSVYLVWPSGRYYKRRFTDPGAKPKYKCPSGHSKPLFIAQEGAGSTCLVVEGEINALSLVACLEASPGDRPPTVVSPGGASDFYSGPSDKYFTFYQQYENIVLIADADKAGALAVIQLKSKLLAAGKTNVITHLMEEDANDMLVKYGKEALKNYVSEKVLGVPPRV